MARFSKYLLITLTWVLIAFFGHLICSTLPLVTTPEILFGKSPLSPWGQAGGQVNQGVPRPVT